MNNLKVVETIGNFELVSYMHKDLTHYAIRAVDSGETYETVAPTKELKGWELRKEMLQKLQGYSSDKPTFAGEVAGFARTASAVLNAKDIEVGMVITYQNTGWMGNQLFCKITKLGEWLAFCIDPNGEHMFWSYESLNARMAEGTFKILSKDKVPAGVTFPEED